MPLNSQAQNKSNSMVKSDSLTYWEVINGETARFFA